MSGILRLPVIRHIRWLWGVYQVHRWARMWGSVGVGLGHINPSDQAVLDAIWKGEA